MLDLLECGRDAADELLAGFGERYAARGSVEQPHTDPPLEGGHCMAQCGARHSELVGRCAEIALPRDSQHRSEFG
jgi:hypothetical protein